VRALVSVSAMVGIFFVNVDQGYKMFIATSGQKIKIYSFCKK